MLNGILKDRLSHVLYQIIFSLIQDDLLDIFFHKLNRWDAVGRLIIPHKNHIYKNRVLHFQVTSIGSEILIGI